jgi:ATP synthase protein I
MSEPPDKHGRTPGEMSPQERAQFKDRISELEDRLGKIRSQRDGEGAGGGSRGRGMAQGLRMAADLVAAIIVGSVIGWGLDWLLGSRPWLFLLFFLLGFAAGILNLVRAYERMQRDLAPGTTGAGTSPGTGPAAGDDD